MNQSKNPVNKTTKSQNRSKKTSKGCTIMLQDKIFKINEIHLFKIHLYIHLPTKHLFIAYQGLSTVRGSGNTKIKRSGREFQQTWSSEIGRTMIILKRKEKVTTRVKQVKFSNFEEKARGQLCRALWDITIQCSKSGLYFGL